MKLEDIYAKNVRGEALSQDEVTFLFQELAKREVVGAMPASPDAFNHLNMARLCALEDIHSKIVTFLRDYADVDFYFDGMEYFADMKPDTGIKKVDETIKSMGRMMYSKAKWQRDMIKWLRYLTTETSK